jgi:hypothetical protein
MSNGAVVKVLEPREREKATIARVSEIDALLWDLRERIRSGDLIGEEDATDEEIGVPA